MFIENAYAKRASLSDRDLGRLADALKEQIERYRVSMEIIPLTEWKSTAHRCFSVFSSGWMR